MEKLFVGVEGGASYSRLAVLNSEGCSLCEVDVAATVSPYFLGPDMAAKKIDAMLMSAADKLNMSRSDFLDNLTVLGLGISGCETATLQNGLTEALYAALDQPSSSRCFIVVCSDSIATALTVFHPRIGGLILISGTGSNCLLLIPSSSDQKMSIVTCGGWGSQLGDFGSAYWLSVEGARHVIETEECFSRSTNKCSTDCSKLDRNALRNTVLTKMGVSSLSELFDIFGPKFSKSNIARLATDFSELAHADDALAKHLFYEAGRHLASMVIGVVRRTEKVHGKQVLSKFLAKSKFQLQIGCTGSMFKSWQMLRPGFLSVIAGPEGHSLRSLYSIAAICLRRLCCSASIGAAVFASISSPQDNTSAKLSIDWPLNSVVFENISL